MEASIKEQDCDVAAVFVNAGISFDEQNCLKAGIIMVEQFEQLPVEELAYDADSVEFSL